MNFVENNGKKVAAILCVASAFPVVATIYAQETAEGWHGNTYVNQDKKIAKGWTEIDGKSYYFDQNGRLDSKKSYNASAATVSTTLKDDVKASVSKSAKASAKEDADPVVEAQPVSVNNSDVQAVNEVSDSVATAQADPATTETPVDAAAPADENTLEVTNVNQPAEEAPAAETNDSEAPAETGNEAPAQNSDANASQPAAETNKPAPAASESQAKPADTNNASQATAPAQTNNSSKPAETKPAAQAQQKPAAAKPAASNNTASNSTSQYADLNARIAAAALAEVGTTDGQQCTEVATGALNAAGVDAAVVWPAEYVQYGYYVSADQATAGNLIYYADGGAGYAHIAVYIGNGQAVQGNFDGKTVVAAADLASYGTGASQAQYIQITG